MSHAQLKTIVNTLKNGGGIQALLDSKLGSMVTEIPVSELNNMETIDMEKLKAKKWKRGQATNLIRRFRKKKGLADSSLTVEDIREMGFASVGVSCKDVKNIQVDEVNDATQALVEETESGFPVDMNGCMAKILHKSTQVMKGDDYMSDVSDPELDVILESIPGDIAAMFPPKELMNIPSASCQGIMGNIGQAQLSIIPGEERKEELAKAVVSCLDKDAAIDDETEVLTLGALICDTETSKWGSFSQDAFVNAISMIHDCFYRLSDEKIEFLRSFVDSKYGTDSSAWDEDDVSSLGPLVSLLSKSLIDGIDKDVFYDLLDDIMPPEVSPESPAYSQINYDNFYSKSLDVIVAQESTAERKKRSDVTPTYDQVVLLGPGNVAWTVNQLNAMSEDDFVNSLATFGTISKWTVEQTDALLARLNTIFGSSSTWSEKVIVDASNLISSLPLSEIALLSINDIATVMELSDIEMAQDKRAAIIDAYLSTADLELGDMADSDIVSFGSLICGLLPSRLIEIPAAVVGSVIMDLGEIDCYDQAQASVLKQLGRGAEIPSDDQLQEMGSLAAGLSSAELIKLSNDSIPFITPVAFTIMTPTRIKLGFTQSQLMAAGVANVDVLMMPSIFDHLYPSQRNALRIAKDGEDAQQEPVPTDEGEDEDLVDEHVIYVSGNGIQNNNGGGVSLFSDDDDDEEGDQTESGNHGVRPYASYLLMLISFLLVML